MNNGKLIQFMFQDHYVEQTGQMDGPIVLGIFTDIETLNREIVRTKFNFREPMNFTSMGDRFEQKDTKNDGVYRDSHSYWLVETTVNTLS